MVGEGSIFTFNINGKYIKIISGHEQLSRTQPNETLTEIIRLLNNKSKNNNEDENILNNTKI